MMRFFTENQRVAMRRRGADFAKIAYSSTVGCENARNRRFVNPGVLNKRKMVRCQKYGKRMAKPYLPLSEKACDFNKWRPIFDGKNGNNHNHNHSKSSKSSLLTGELITEFGVFRHDMANMAKSPRWSRGGAA